MCRGGILDSYGAASQEKRGKSQGRFMHVVKEDMHVTEDKGSLS